MRKRFALFGILVLVTMAFSLALNGTVTAQISKGSNWIGRYYNNPNFAGVPTFERIDPAVEFNFGAGAVVGPGSLTIGPNNYSIRWTTQENFVPGTYTFTLSREDDARVTLNGVEIIAFNNADLTSPQFVQATVQVPGGVNTLTVEFIKRTGNGSIQFQWQPTTPGGIGPTPQPTATATRTPLPPIPPGAITATVVRASVLNVRNAPSLGGQIIGRILRGERYAIVGRDERARWFLLQLGGYQGWAYGFYLFVDGNEFTPPVTSPFGTLGVPPGVVDTGVVAQSTSTLRLRAAPTVASAQIGRVTWGGFLPVIGRTPDGFWYEVVWKGTVGWVYSPFTRITQGDINAVPVR